MNARARVEHILKCIPVIFLTLLFFYPMRKLSLGVDLWDGGYNFANFRYPGPEHMDSMWYFATWIANGLGSFFTKFPGGERMIGMNIYTGLLVSLLATAGFLFCIKTLKIPSPIAFAAQLCACALCWLPTAALYNYLTFLFLMGACILLYIGLVQDKNIDLGLAGVLLGLNVGVRFSNLVQVGLILMVWLYLYWNRTTWKETSKKILNKTLICMAGYFAALTVLLLTVSLRYGADTYFESVMRLFSMTKVAKDYTPLSMLGGLVQAFADNGYWLKRFALAFVVLTVLSALLIRCAGRFAKGKAQKAIYLICWLPIPFFFKWLNTLGFAYGDPAMYSHVDGPCIILFVMAIAVSVFLLLKKETDKQLKLMSLMEILLLFLTSLGGNNGEYYCINNLFLVLPISFYQLYRLWKEYPSKYLYGGKVLATSLSVWLVILALGFGHSFYYEEAAGGRNADTLITGIPVLEGMHTGMQKAQALTGLYNYIQNENLTDRQCILYGQIPGVAYYMGLEPCMNVWPDLDSYDIDLMRAKLDEVGDELRDGQPLQEGKIPGEGQPPLVIIESTWAKYLETGEQPESLLGVMVLPKAELMKAFIEKQNYQRTYSNEKFVVFEKIQ